MKAAHSLLAFAGAALAVNVPRFAGNGRRWGGGGGGGGWESTAETTATMTTYTTTSVCPITTTTVEKGTTKTNTVLVTSTIVVTTCKGCGGLTATVPGPTSIVSTTSEVEVTVVRVSSAISAAAVWKGRSSERP